MSAARRPSTSREEEDDNSPSIPDATDPAVAYLVNADGLMLYCQRWETLKPKALIFIAHGLAEHIGYYKELAQELNQNSIYVFAHDHVGHGRSEGIRAYVENFSDYVRDVFQHIDLVRSKHPDLPTFIIGHSMGGTIAIKSAMQRPDFFQGVILIGPAVVPSPDLATPLKVFVARTLSRLIPRFPVGGLSYDNITRDRIMIEFMKKDNLRHHGLMSAKWATEMLETLQEIHKNLSTINWPFLILHGDSDKLCDVSGSKSLYSLANSKDKELKIYKDAYHNLICELTDVRREALNEICGWILPRIDERASRTRANES